MWLLNNGSVILYIDAQRDQINEWLHAPDFKYDLDATSQLRHPGTCEWLLKLEQYEAWKTSNAKDIIWMHGAPCSGKTVLASAVINQLRLERKPVAYFFFRADEKVIGPPKNTTISCLNALVAQLLGLMEAQHTPFPDDFRRIYMEEKHNGQVKLTNVHTALKVIRALLNVSPRVHIVVDGLDECLDRQDFAVRRVEFHKVMKELITYSYTGIVKLFFGSRHERIFEKLFTKPGRIIEVTQEHTATDIAVFLNDNDYVWGEEQDGIIYPLVTGGNFLEAALELSTQNYAGVTCEEELKEAQWQYKPGFTTRYCRSLEMLAARSPQEKRLAKFVVFS